MIVAILCSALIAACWIARLYQGYGPGPSNGPLHDLIEHWRHRGDDRL